MSKEPVVENLSAKSADFSQLSSSTSSRHNLPATTTRVVGRAGVIDLLQHEVTRSRLVSIVGAGGIGKTTVALAVAEQAIGAFVEKVGCKVD